MENLITVPYQKLSDAIEDPAYAYEGDAGLDLRSTIEYDLQPFERVAVPTGVAVAIPEGYAGLIIPRSGLAVKHGISIVNAPGLVDSGYRGELRVTLVNLDAHNTFHIGVGDRIAQIMFAPFAHALLQGVQSLDETERGAKGFGSSGR